MDKRRTPTTTTASFNWAFGAAVPTPKSTSGGAMKERNYRKKLERQPWWKNTEKPFFRTLYKHAKENGEQVDIPENSKTKETVVVSSTQEELSNQFLAAAFDAFAQMKQNRRPPTNNTFKG